MPSMNRNVHTSVTTVMKSGTVTTRPVKKLRRNQPIYLAASQTSVIAASANR